MKINCGDKFPNIPLSMSSGEKTSTIELLNKKTVFWVIRYIGCTVCRYDVYSLKKNYAQIEEKGAQVVVVMQSDEKHINDSLADDPAPFKIACDPEMQFYKTLSIECAKDKDELLGDLENGRFPSKKEKAIAAGFVHGDYEGDEMQLPAVFIVEKDGTASFVKYGSYIADIPTVEELIDIL